MKKIILIFVLLVLIFASIFFFYISQNQDKKARDYWRIQDLNYLKSSIEMYYLSSGDFKYPSSLQDEELLTYLYNWLVPEDPNDWEVINWCTFGYNYEVFDDQDWNKNSKYKLSSCLESSSVKKTHWKWDVYETWNY